MQNAERESLQRAEVGREFQFTLLKIGVASRRQADVSDLDWQALVHGLWVAVEIRKAGDRPNRIDKRRSAAQGNQNQNMECSLAGSPNG